ncbi:MAG: RrF2 family transcriptional regulator [Chloroflexia bacterium]
MRISTRGRYALRAMVDLARHEAEGPVPRGAIAERERIPALYLARLLAQLVRAELIRAERGPGGGYRLARPAAEIRALDILRAVEPLDPTPCRPASGGKPCPRLPSCPSGYLWQQVGQAISEVLERVTLQDLCAETLPRPSARV